MPEASGSKGVMATSATRRDAKPRRRAEQTAHWRLAEPANGTQRRAAPAAGRARRLWRHNQGPHFGLPAPGLRCDCRRRKTARPSGLQAADQGQPRRPPRSRLAQAEIAPRGRPERGRPRHPETRERSDVLRSGYWIPCAASALPCEGQAWTMTRRLCPSATKASMDEAIR